MLRIWRIPPIIVESLNSTGLRVMHPTWFQNFKAQFIDLYVRLEWRILSFSLEEQLRVLS